MCLLLALVADPFSARADESVSLGLVGGTGNAGFFVAVAEGYFKSEGLDVKIIPFDAAAKMTPMLGTGQLDVAAGSASAALYNAAARRIDLKIVAGFTRTAPNNPYYALVVRKEVIENGTFKGYPDLKKLRIALNAPGVSSGSVANEAAKRGGLGFSDLNISYLGFPQQVAAFQSGAIDATFTVEPFVSGILRSNSGKVFASVNDFFPNYQIGLVMFGEQFMARRATAERFLKAYIRGTEDYKKVVKVGSFVAGERAERIVSIIAKAINASDDQVRNMYAPDNDVGLELSSLKIDLEFMKNKGDVTDRNINVDQLVDLSFLANALQSLENGITK
jgi:NitT/TauT family transport system substrate-binding protein